MDDQQTGRVRKRSEGRGEDTRQSEPASCPVESVREQREGAPRKVAAGPRGLLALRLSRVVPTSPSQFMAHVPP